MKKRDPKTWQNNRRWKSLFLKKLIKVHSYIERHVRQTSPKKGDYRATEYFKKAGGPL